MSQAGYTWCVVIDEDLLLNAVHTLGSTGKLARADTVCIELGVADDGGHWELATVADDLAELESLGKLERPAAFEWEGIGPPPKTRIAYALTGE
jgi:hypothetical protein